MTMMALILAWVSMELRESGFVLMVPAYERMDMHFQHTCIL